MPSEDTRERSIRRLRRGYVLGRLSTDTFERRVGCAIETPDTGELERLVEDLPGGRTARAGSALLDALLGAGRRNRPPRLAALSAKRTLRIGRAPDCDIVLTDDTVSRVHAELLMLDGRWNLRDTNSTNGTWVNGRRLRGQLEIEPGDVVMFGDVAARF